MATGAIVPTASLVDGANFLKKDGSVTLTGALNFGNQLGTTVADPISSQDVVNLRTLQVYAAGFGVSKRARMIFTTNVALSGLQNTDGVTGIAGDIVWLNAQTTGSQGALWVMNAGAWTRPVNWAAASSQKSCTLFIEEGTTYKDTKWTVAADAIVVDTTTVVATQDFTGVTYVNGAGLSLTGNTFAVKLAAAGGLSFDGTSSVQVVPNGASLNVSASGVKITDGTAGQVMLAGAAGAAAFTSMTGDVTITSGGVATVNNTSGSGFVKYGNFVFNETPAGTVNGANTAFTLAFAPANASLDLMLNGVTLEPGAGNDYTISGTAITMLLVPQTGDKLRAAMYFK